VLGQQYFRRVRAPCPAAQELGPFAKAVSSYSSVFVLTPPPDCDCDGIPDGIAILKGISADTDRDGVPDSCEHAEGDLNLDGDVDGADLAILLGAWGRCASCPADLDANGTVDAADLAILLGTWTP